MPFGQHRLSFGTSSINNKNTFELIHCDIWGPYKIKSLFGAKYFLSMVDDYSRFTWVFLMHQKSETPLLRQFISFVQTQFHIQVKTIRTDNGREFLSLRSFFQRSWHCIPTFMCLYASTKWSYRTQAPPHSWNGACLASTKHLTNSFMVDVLLFLIYEFLVVLPMQQIHMFLINLIPEQSVVFFWVTPLVKKPTNSMTWTLNKSSQAGIFFMKILILFKHCLLQTRHSSSLLVNLLPTRPIYLSPLLLPYQPQMSPHSSSPSSPSSSSPTTPHNTDVDPSPHPHAVEPNPTTLVTTPELSPTLPVDPSPTPTCS